MPNLPPCFKDKTVAKICFSMGFEPKNKVFWTPYLRTISKGEYISAFSLILLLFSKAPCSDDYYPFPNTHLLNSLPIKTVVTETVEECLQLCCKERSFECMSVSVHHNTSECLLFAEDRNTSPPLAISQVPGYFFLLKGNSVEYIF